MVHANTIKRARFDIDINEKDGIVIVSKDVCVFNFLPHIISFKDNTTGISHTIAHVIMNYNINYCDIEINIASNTAFNEDKEQNNKDILYKYLSQNGVHDVPDTLDGMLQVTKHVIRNNLKRPHRRFLCKKTIDLAYKIIDKLQERRLVIVVPKNNNNRYPKSQIYSIAPYDVKIPDGFASLDYAKNWFQLMDFLRDIAFYHVFSKAGYKNLTCPKFVAYHTLCTNPMYKQCV